MGASLVGWVLIAVGLVALAAGVAGGVATMLRQLTHEDEGEIALAAAPPVDLLPALRAFVQALASAPVWLALVAIGVFLIAWGGTMIGAAS